MKTKSLIFTVIFSIGFYFLSFSQWETQYPLPTGNNMDEVFFVDPLNGWIVCQDNYYHRHQPYILHTNDGGINWEGQECDTEESLMDVYFIDLNHGWAVGNNGVVIRTINGGSNWEVINCPTNEDLRAVVFLNENTGVVVGNNGTVIKTNDTGLTWELVNLNSAIDFCDIAIAGQKIWIIGDDNDSGDLFCSNDGGNTWELIHTMTTQSHWFTSVYFTDQDNGWITECYLYSGGWVSYFGTIIKTTDDGGLTWREVESIGWDLLGSLSFCNSDIGWVKGWQGSCYKTEDGGNTWTSQNCGGSTSRSVFCLDADNVWLLGSNVVYYSNDLGGFWQKQLEIISSSFQSVFFIDSERGWAAGSSKLMYTNNGGLYWELVNDTIGGYDIYFTDENHGWIAGHSGMIYHTSDGGNSWEIQESGTTDPLNSIHFTDPLNGWVAGGGYYGYDTVLFHTTDGGNSWHPQEIFGDGIIYSLFFTDESHGWAACGSYLLYTTNGGEIWDSVNIVNQYEYYIKTLYFVDNLNGWIAGGDGAILRTFDGGLTWEPQYSGVESMLKSIFFIDEYQGWVGGGDYNYPAVILHTSDGGNTWQNQCNDVGRWFTSVYFSDFENGWAVGFSGIIMHTDNGGAVWVPENLDNRLTSEISIYPNPSSGRFNLSYMLSKPGIVKVNVLNLHGETLQNFSTGNQNPGEHILKVDLSQLPDGLYFIRLQAGKRVETVKVVLLK